MLIGESQWKGLKVWSGLERTARIWSANFAKLAVSREAFDEAKISWVVVGRRWRNSCFIIEGSSWLSPSNLLHSAKKLGGFSIS